MAWSVWLAMLAAAMLLVARYGSNVPSWDDWDMVPTLTRAQPVTLDWLWSQHNEHRVPLPRLLFLAFNRLLTVDFRVTMYVDVLAMAALAAALMLAGRRLRGRTSVVDLFFPLLLLDVGQAVNLLWGWQLEFFLSAVLAGVALIAIARSGGGTDPRRAGMVVGVCAMLLPLCGANGLGMAPALALWPLALALLPVRWTGAPTARGSRPLIVLGVGALVLVAVYFIGWQPVPYHPKSHSLYQVPRTALQFVTVGLGPAVQRAWPWSGLLAAGVFGASALLLLRVWQADPEERARTGGLLLFCGAMASLALGLGLGRNGFETRYVTLAVPVWCWAYLVWCAYGGPLGASVAPGLLAVAAIVALAPNARYGLSYAKDLRMHLAGFESDMAAGVPLCELVHRYDPYLHPHQDVPLEYLPMLRRAGVGGYIALRDDPPFRSVPLTLAPAKLRDAAWRDSTARTRSGDPYIDFVLPGDRYVAGIRLKYQNRSDDGTLPYIGLRWKRRDLPDFPGRNFKKYSPTGDRANWERGTWTRTGEATTTMTVWISDTIGQIRITPNYVPGLFRIRELVLLVPAEQ
jgi:hypothetical protein